MAKPRKLSAAAMAARQSKFFRPDGSPRYLRIYDNGGETFDRYTAVFSGRYRRMTGGEFIYLGMSARPFHPQGFGQHGQSDSQIDRPGYSHLGKPLPFADLPPDCRRLVMRDYAELWNVKPPAPAPEVTSAAPSAAASQGER